MRTTRVQNRFVQNSYRTFLIFYYCNINDSLILVLWWLSLGYTPIIESGSLTGKIWLPVCVIIIKLVSVINAKCSMNVSTTPMISMYRFLFDVSKPYFDPVRLEKEPKKMHIGLSNISLLSDPNNTLIMFIFAIMCTGKTSRCVLNKLFSWKPCLLCSN